MDGILPLYKECGITSNDAVIKCRKLFQTRKIGHSGTLDPNVDGVLPLCIGKATKVVEYLLNSEKKYVGQIILGFTTETEDLDGKVLERTPLIKSFKDSQIQLAMNSMEGDIIQTPPMYSAVKVNGKRLYQYARDGETVKRPKRRIHIDYFKMTSKSKFNIDRGEQTINFEISCSKGTYIRTMAVDLGKKLNVASVMSKLTRIESGGFNINQSYTIDQLNNLRLKNKLDGALYPIDYIFKKYDHVILNNVQWNIVKNGGFLKPIYICSKSDKIILIYKNKVRAVYFYDKKSNLYKVERMINLTD